MPIASTIDDCVRNTSCTPAPRSPDRTPGRPGTNLAASGRPRATHRCRCIRRRAGYAFTTEERSAEQDGRAEMFRDARRESGGSAVPSDGRRRRRRWKDVARSGRCRQVDVQLAALRGTDTDGDEKRHIRTGTSAPITHPRRSGSRRTARRVQQLDRTMPVASQTQRQPGREASRDDAQAQYKPEEQPDRNAHAGGTMRDLATPSKQGRRATPASALRNHLVHLATVVLRHLRERSGDPAAQVVG